MKLKITGFLTALVGWVLRTFLKDPKAADVITSAGSKSYLEYSEWVGRRQQYALDFRKKVRLKCRVIQLNN